MKNRFNLLHEKWIPVDNHGLVSLRDIFSRFELRAIGGTPIQKVAIFKLLQAITQSVCTPADEAEWSTLDAKTLANRCLSYLDERESAFYLYGEDPFLQLTVVATTMPKSYGCVIPHVSNGNTTVLTQIQQGRPLGDAEKALLLVTLMSFAFAGKQCDNSLVLSVGYMGKGKGSSAPPGPALADPGLLHSMILADALLNTLHINLLTHEQIKASKMYSSGLGVAPWERMPVGEDCPAARDLKNSLMGRLVPMCRFLLLQQDHLNITEGLKHPGYQDGRADPTVSVDHTGDNPRAKWVDPERRPWRQLSSILALFGETSSTGFQCLQLKTGLNRVRRTLPSFAIWAGGIRLKIKFGEQYVQAGNDYVESIVWLHSTALGEVMFTAVKTELDDLEQLSRTLAGRVIGYHETLSVHKKAASERTNTAESMFWQMVERDFQALVYACEPDTDSQVERMKLRRKFANHALLAFDATCAKSSARQMTAWAKFRINIKPYLGIRAMQTTVPKHSSSFAERFVGAVISKCETDTGTAAKLRRAIRPSQEHQAWDFLVRFGVDLEDDYARIPALTVAAAIAGSRTMRGAKKNGEMKLGKALAKSFDDGANCKGAIARLRRLVACDTLAEVSTNLRYLLPLIDSRCDQRLDYVRLMHQLHDFPSNPQQIKRQWAMEFYGQPIYETTGEDL